jgi:cysteine desulfurase
MARALQLALAEQAAEHSRLLTLRDQLLDGLTSLSPRIHPTIDYQQVASLPHIISVLVDGYESESLILSLDEAGFAVSGGSACSTGSLDPSHVMLALGLERQQAQSVLRISLGHQTTASEIAAFVQAVASIVSR